MSQLHSPFPGMDPYLEARWSDVHVKLIAFMGETIQPLLPRDLRARGEERLLHESSPVIDRWLQITDVTSGNRVVTAIEILSPWNKAPGRLNRQYLRKLDDYGKVGVSVVEINLLRDPPRGRLPVTESHTPRDHRSAYLTRVRLGWKPETWRAYPMSSRLPLPIIPIPLRRAEAEIGLNLQPLVDRVYVAGGHDDIDYSKPAEPPLSESDAAWASELIARRAEEIPQKYADAVAQLTRWQGESAPAGAEVYWFPDPSEQSVRLTVISDEFLESGQAWALSMGPSAEFPFRSEVMLLTRREWDRVLGGAMSFPAGGDVASTRRVWP
jgi:hypothetical protein